MAGTAQKRKEVATEPASDTRASTRTKTASSKQREISESESSPLPRASHVSQHQDEQADTKLQKELENLKRQLATQKRKNQKLAEMVQGNSCFRNLKASWLNPLMSESHDDVDEGSGPESEEPDEEPSAMQFSNAVGTSFWTLPLYDLMTSLYIQIRSKGVVEQPKKPKARKATDPPPVHNGHDILRGPEQNQARSPTMPPQSPPPPPSPSLQDQTPLPDLSGSTLRAPNEKRTRVTAKAYPKHNKLLIAATRVYYVKIWTSDPFPDDKVQAQWAVDSWDTVSDGIPLPDTSAIQYVSVVL